MAEIVANLERHTLSMAATETGDTSATSLTTANSIIINSFTNGTGAVSDDDASVDAFFNGTNVEVSRIGSAGSIEIEIQAAEFDPGQTTVQAGTFSIANDATSDTEPLTTVVVVDSFQVISWEDNGTISSMLNRSCRASFTATTMTFERAFYGGDPDNSKDGHWFLVECDANEFDVKHGVTNLAASDLSEDLVITAVVMARTHVMAQVETENGNMSPDEYATDTFLQSTTAVRSERFDGTSVSDVTIQAIQYAASIIAGMQRGVVSGTGTTQTIVPSTFEATKSIAMLPCYPQTGAFDHNHAGDPETETYMSCLITGGNIELDRAVAATATVQQHWELSDLEDTTAAGISIPVVQHHRQRNF